MPDSSPRIAPTPGGQSEIEEANQSVITQEDVGWLQITVQQAAGMDGCQAPGRLRDKPRRLGGVHRLLTMGLPEVAAGDVLDDQQNLVAEPLDAQAPRHMGAAHPGQARPPPARLART